ncbi:hypothetical protein GCM10007242_45630 [Pigmentiphaga litoralis]|uniref:hypothetical protein n=1 Tax=Pigmentiphaga litoralis TaxID=516702 RepID=UPI001676A276|nr:hypothetical protein [Pigmentiphaga litoralis]GGX33342.1 hypothetical protein GCM10007242_45630 [Pigmentiphaga litoralis]
MKERSILFSGPMVRALLAGIKTQTRRVVKPQPTGFVSGPDVTTAHGLPAPRMPIADTADPPGQIIACPYGEPGDRLRVRETFFAYGRWETRHNETKHRDEWRFVDMTIACGRAYHYAADGADLALSTRQGGAAGWHKRSALFMPRAASRIVLDVVSVRVERLNDCSEQDAMAEGIGLDAEGIGMRAAADGEEAPAISAYRSVWESINGTGSWSANPWVWVVEFKRRAP